MSRKEYKLEVNRRECKPRSKRLRSIGAVVAGNGSTVVEVSGSGSQHSHANLATLDKLSADEDGYVYLDHLREGTDDEGNPVWTTEREKIKSCYADTAQNLSEDSGDWEKIDKKDADALQAAKTYADETALSKVHADTAQKLITFKEGLVIGDIILTYDETNKALKVANVNDDAQGNLYATGGVSAYGFSGTGSGGGTATVDVEQILSSGTPIATVAGVTLYAPKGGASSWAELTGRPEWLTDEKPKVGDFQNDAGYLTAAALSGYATTAEVDHKDDQVLASVEQNYVKKTTFETYKSGVTKAISDSAQGVKDWVALQGYATEDYVKSQKYGKSLGINDKYLRLLDEGGNKLNEVIAPYAAYTEQLGTSYGTHNGLKTQYWSKNDNSGYPTYLLISEVCNASEWASWGTGHPLFGISGTVSGARSGNLYGTGTWHVNACVSYSTNYILTETSNSQWMQPCVVTYNGKVYVALRLLGSSYDIIFVGNYTNLLATPIQVNCTDASGTCSAISVLRDYTGVRLAAKDLDVTGSLTVSGRAYLPGQNTYFGHDGIFIQTDRTTQTYGSAAYIGIHRSFSGVGTIATVNLDGRVRIWQPMGINQDPEDGISLRVGGTLKTDFLTAGGMARPDGYWFASPNGYFGNLPGIYTSFGDGGIELSQKTPYIDFHYGSSPEDYTSRLIASEVGVLQIDSATADPALRIGNAYLRYDTVNNALYVTGQNGAQVHLYATGGIAAYSGLGSGITQLANLSLTGQLTAASVKTSSVESSGTFHLNAGSGCDIILNGNATVDPDGWITAPWLAADERLHVEEGGILSISSTAANHAVTDLYADGSYVYITVNGKKYKLYCVSVTSV